MAEDCLFCRIVAGEIPSERVADADGIVAIRDISPRAPVHVLVIPERHVDSAHDLGPDDAGLLADCFAMCARVAEQEGIADGYRITTNVGELGGQSIAHLHFHVLGGRQLGHIDSGSPEPPA
ncbi:histidine triad nucleotide-binding protein [Egicoccus sp. AB-alg2]|uniref:histidine triad nucleotide-binding protein n=1 Tax=Egicoccus sp. AB-alg2 TaxID=3242693 RepID=UPI00359CFF4F